MWILIWREHYRCPNCKRYTGLHNKNGEVVGQELCCHLEARNGKATI